MKINCHFLQKTDQLETFDLLLHIVYVIVSGKLTEFVNAIVAGSLQAVASLCTTKT